MQARLTFILAGIFGCLIGCAGSTSTTDGVGNLYVFSDLNIHAHGDCGSGISGQGFCSFRCDKVDGTTTPVEWYNNVCATPDDTRNPGNESTDCNSHCNDQCKILGATCSTIFPYCFRWEKKEFEEHCEFRSKDTRCGLWNGVNTDCKK